ncbi:hypothetical protein [uncultured Mediterranean phage uvDeep-CGR2-AD3-C191]|nr:hypothetical protein [uncultured Mediterranean phage uvDeep-CGR2-AD3-C191]
MGSLFKAPKVYVPPPPPPPPALPPNIRVELPEAPEADPSIAAKAEEDRVAAIAAAEAEAKAAQEKRVGRRKLIKTKQKPGFTGLVDDPDNPLELKYQTLLGGA